MTDKIITLLRLKNAKEMQEKYVYFFGDGDTKDRNLLGGKGANLGEMTIENIQKVRKNVEIGVCGEHGGDPESVKYFYSIGITSVSASPYRVPVSILAAAQAAIEKKK